VLTKKSEGRPVTPEEYTLLGQFVDRVERRTIQIREEAAREEEDRIAAIRDEIPVTAFDMPLDQAGLTDHVYTILTEGQYENVGDLILAMKIDPDSVLGLPGIGPKAMENLQETLSGLTFPEPEPVVEEIPEVEQPPEPEVVEEAEAQVEPGEVEIVEQEPVPAEAELVEAVEGVDAEQAATDGLEDSDRVKDSVSLDELFALKEMFQSGPSDVEEDDSSDDKKKGKKKKKKHVEIEYDEELGEVIARKKHKRGDGDAIETEW
jgi:N utilization substance protein A